jgi:kievitone hydratase
MLPTAFNLSAGWTNVGTGDVKGGMSSFWTSSFIHASNAHDYLVVSHVVLVPDGPITVYRGSFFDITTKQYSMFDDVIIAAEQIYSPPSVGGIFSASRNASYFFGAVPSSLNTSTPQLRTWSSVPGVGFDLTFDLASKPLLNAGIGAFQVEGGWGFEYALPAMKVTGSLLVNGTNVTADSTRSMTWFDRQWGLFPDGWTWFEVNLPATKPGEDGTKMSIWHWADHVNGNKTFATIRDGDVQKVMAVTSFQPSTRTFHSQSTGFTYPLDWDLVLADDTKLQISSTLPDQQLHSPEGTFASYTGYVTIDAQLMGCSKAKGYGLVEIYSGSS